MQSGVSLATDQLVVAQIIQSRLIRPIWRTPRAVVPSYDTELTSIDSATFQKPSYFAKKRFTECTTPPAQTRGREECIKTLEADSGKAGASTPRGAGQGAPGPHRQPAGTGTAVGSSGRWHPSAARGKGGERKQANIPLDMPPVPDLGQAEAAFSSQKRKTLSPPHSSNGHSPSESSPSGVKKKKKPGLVTSNNKDQCELRHGPFYYVKQPALTADPVDVVPQDGRNDFYCWMCHREGQVLCCELCPRVYHAKCLKLAAEPEGDWFCPECEKITVAECIETQSKAMTMLNLEQLSYLLKFALQKMKQPGTEPFHKPVSLEQHPDYAEYIFNPMDLCTLEKNIKKKIYGCTEAFLADVKWILHDCIIYNGGNHKLTATAKVIVKICEHEMNEIEVCPECYLSACQKRDNWFCEPCSQPHSLVWAKLKGFPFWPAKALRDKDGQVDARFFGQHDRAWVPINNCYLMSKEIPFSVKKTKSIFNSAMQEMEVYVENVRKKHSVFNYAPFRTPYTPNNMFQMLLDPSNPKKGTVMPEKQDKIKFNFDMTASPRTPLGKNVGHRISDMPRSPISTNSSVHTGSDLEQDASEKGTRIPSSHYSTGEDSMDCTVTHFVWNSNAVICHKASPACLKTTGSPKANRPTPLKQERTQNTASILNLNLGELYKNAFIVKAEMDLKELSKTVQQQQGLSVQLTSPKKPTRSLDKTIESCKAQLGIDEISEDVYQGVDPSDSDDFEKSESSDGEYVSEEVQEPKIISENEDHKETVFKNKKRPRPLSTQPINKKSENVPEKVASEPPSKKKASVVAETVAQEKPVAVDADSDSERELVIDLGEEQGEKVGKKPKKEDPSIYNSIIKDNAAVKTEGRSLAAVSQSVSPSTLPSASSSKPITRDLTQPDIKPPPSTSALPTNSANTTSIMDAVKGTMAEIYSELPKITTGNTISEMRRLRIEIERLQWLHQQELSEMKHNLELTMAEMRQSLEQERERLVFEVKKQMEVEKQQAVDKTKKKQWCANCKKEAIFYCCWNTSYCDYPCQQAHWPEHMKSCTQSAAASQQETEEEASVVSVPKTFGQSPKAQHSPTNSRNSPTHKTHLITTDNTKASTIISSS
ncbi:Protein kinase C-binding protein 1 [Bagarius yarrelli]|uniref:Protein kinase C-binding protein 1 n=1 Tax=Bagarius yarrelli TaxID=175774 RepID=A0A556VAB6_BAGYA|nr:Protein kinase C-binding protein 1 [Bagarius yarrelli]